MWMIGEEYEAEAIRELRADTDRAAAIVGAAILERRLELSLKAPMQRDKHIEDAMFHTSGPLGSFSAKIKLGYMLGFYSMEAYRDLDNLKEIRNRFAHKLDIRNFESESIKARCENFKLLDKHIIQRKPESSAVEITEGGGMVMYIDDRDATLKIPRWRYIMTAMLFTTYLALPRPLHSKPRL